MSGSRLLSPATTHAHATTPSRDRRSLRLPLIVSLVCSLVFIARTAFEVNGDTYFTLFDDAMISMRYARNLAQGHGLLWNPGQAPVEGYTNFLWTLWMALLQLLPIPESKMALTIMFTGVLILIANLVVVRKIAERIAPEAPLAVSLSVWLTALYYPLIYWTLRGMEVGLVTLTVSMSVLLALRLRDRVRRQDLTALAALMVAGILTRPDVVVPCAVIAGFVCWTAPPGSRRVVAMVLLGAIVGTLALHTTFRIVYYGAPLPNTYYLKVQGAALGGRVFRGLLGLLVFDLLHLIVPVVLSAGYLLAHARKAGAASAPNLLAALFVVLCAYSVYVGGDAWDNLQYANRYITPAMPGLLILSAMAIDALVREQTPPRRMVVQGVACLFLLVGLAAAAVPVMLEDLPVTPLDERLRMARVALTLTPVAVLALLLVPTPSSRRRSIVAVALAVASVVAINGQAASIWLSHNASYVHDDAWATRYGLALRAATADDATIAVTWAGAIPYFSHRSTIDLLGKSDPVIATGKRQPSIGFNPGHDKWDYDFSIGRLRPDVVAELWHPSDRDLQAIERYGYIRLAPWVFARADSTRIDRTAVKAAACTILAEDPLVLGSIYRSNSDLESLRARFCR